MNEIEFLKEVEETTEQLYQAYGSSSGFLFGIPPNLKSAVYAIIKVISRNKLDSARADEREKIIKLIEDIVDEKSWFREEVIKEIKKLK